jgi:hypothetical protein
MFITYTIKDEKSRIRIERHSLEEIEKGEVRWIYLPHQIWKILKREIQSEDIELLKDKLSRRNMQIKELKKNYNKLLNAHSTEELKKIFNIKV